MLSQDVTPLPQLTEQVNLRHLKKLLSNQYLQETALVFTTSSKLHEEIESAGEKNNVYYFQGRQRPFPQHPTPQTTYFESNCSKILRQTRNTTSNRISFKVTQFSNIFPDNAVEGGKQIPCNRNALGSKIKKVYSSATLFRSYNSIYSQNNQMSLYN